MLKSEQALEVEKKEEQVEEERFNWESVGGRLFGKGQRKRKRNSVRRL